MEQRVSPKNQIGSGEAVCYTRHPAKIRVSVPAPVMVGGGVGKAEVRRIHVAGDGRASRRTPPGSRVGGLVEEGRRGGLRLAAGGGLLMGRLGSYFRFDKSLGFLKQN
jgi:hypothetical protein